MSVQIRPARSGDGQGADADYLRLVAERDPFYERHLGYERRSILFQKPLS
jgi:hypothetical protein